jgi:hypothetical protein
MARSNGPLLAVRQPIGKPVANRSESLAVSGFGEQVRHFIDHLRPATFAFMAGAGGIDWLGFVNSADWIMAASGAGNGFVGSPRGTRSGRNDYAASAVLSACSGSRKRSMAGSSRASQRVPATLMGNLLRDQVDGGASAPQSLNPATLDG